MKLWLDVQRSPEMASWITRQFTVEAVDFELFAPLRFFEIGAYAEFGVCPPGIPDSSKLCENLP